MILPYSSKKFLSLYVLCSLLDYILIVLIVIFFPIYNPIFADNLVDLLDPDRLTRIIKANNNQKPILIDKTQKLRKIISDYQWERAKRTCEATLWQGHIPNIHELRELRKIARKKVDILLGNLKTKLNPKQARRVDQLLKGKGNILDLKVIDIPFTYINNTPLFFDFQAYRKAYRFSVPGNPFRDVSWSYIDLLRIWTTRSFIPDLRQDSIVQDQISMRSNLKTQILDSSHRAQIVRSPLLVSATLFVPDLGREEFELLWEHYHPDIDKISFWTKYQEKNRLEDAIQIRLKLSTPFAEEYLNLRRWIIYLEDSEGIGYEPIQTHQEAFHPIQALEISVPGQEIEVTDVFGTYYPYIPGHKETYYLKAPEKITYAGNEKLLRLFFPLKNFQNQSVVNEKTKFLKLIVQSQETNYGRTELVWDLKRSKSKAHSER